MTTERPKPSGSGEAWTSGVEEEDFMLRTFEEIRGAVLVSKSAD
jgi:hypothetical protein